MNLDLNWAITSLSHTCCSKLDIFFFWSPMPKHRWKVILLSEGMLIWNCQQLFWRIPWLLWSLHPTGCPNFDTGSHGLGYLYILWENRFPRVADHPLFTQDILRIETELVIDVFVKGHYESSFFFNFVDIIATFFYKAKKSESPSQLSLAILTLYWFSLWNLCCFSARPPAVTLTASPTGGSLWHKSVGPDAEWSPLMRLHFQEPHPSPLQDNQPTHQWNTTQQTWITSIAPVCSFYFYQE